MQGDKVGRKEDQEETATLAKRREIKNEKRRGSLNPWNSRLRYTVVLGLDKEELAKKIVKR